MIFDIDDIYEIEEEYKIKLEQKDKEIERLNNIINKIEEAVEEQRDYYDTNDYAYFQFDLVIERIKELKKGE